MLNEILTAAAIPSKAAQFADPPKVTYAVYFDSVDGDGPDGERGQVFTQNCTIELYAPVLDEDAKRRIEGELNARGIHYTTQGWYWLDATRRYQEIYEFTYIEKT